MSEQKLISDVKVFGSAITQVGPDQRHAGIVFKSRDTGRLCLLHLAWHLQLKLEDLPARYSLVPMVNFDEEELHFFAESAAKLFEANSSNIPYGLSYTGASVFSGDLVFLDRPGAGLTCATFILGFFEALGYSVLDLATWQSREDDKAWQQHIYKLLENRLSKEEAAEQKKLIGSAYRLRPEEVVGSVGVYNDEALSFTKAQALGAQVLSEMES